MVPLVLQDVHQFLCDVSRTSPLHTCNSVPQLAHVIFTLLTMQQVKAAPLGVVVSTLCCGCSMQVSALHFRAILLNVWLRNYFLFLRAAWRLQNRPQKCSTSLHISQYLRTFQSVHAYRTMHLCVHSFLILVVAESGHKSDFYDRQSV